MGRPTRKTQVDAGPPHHLVADGQSGLQSRGRASALQDPTDVPRQRKDRGSAVRLVGDPRGTQGHLGYKNQIPSELLRRIILCATKKASGWQNPFTLLNRSDCASCGRKAWGKSDTEQFFHNPRFQWIQQLNYQTVHYQNTLQSLCSSSCLVLAHSPHPKRSMFRFLNQEIFLLLSVLCFHHQSEHVLVPDLKKIVSPLKARL